MTHHKAVLIATRHNADGSVSWCYGCCDDPNTYSWITMGNHHTLTDEEIDKLHEVHRLNIQHRHHVILEHKKTLHTNEFDIDGHHVTITEHWDHHNEGVGLSMLCCGTYESDHVIEQVRFTDVEQTLRKFAEQTADEHKRHASAERLVAKAQKQIEKTLGVTK